MNNKTSGLIITLTVIGIVSAILLAFVYQWTTPYIEKHQAKAQEAAVFTVLPEAERYQEVTKDGMTFFEGYDSANSRVGVAMVVTGGGFQGNIELMVGVDLSKQQINTISILNHQETPGLGARITEKAYRNNFANKPFGEYQVVKREPTDPMQVEAISGATISSEKVTIIVENAIQKIQQAYGGGA